jgi:hypothetical protein
VYSGKYSLFIVYLFLHYCVGERKCGKKEFVLFAKLNIELVLFLLGNYSIILVFVIIAA